MATFDDILHDAQPALQFGRSHVVDEVTEGRDWFWTFEIADHADALIDLDDMGVTGECVVYESLGGAVLITLDVEIVGTQVTITASDDDTAGLADGHRQSPRRCPWRFTLTETATGRTADVWGAFDSMLLIREDA